MYSMRIVLVMWRFHSIILNITHRYLEKCVVMQETYKYETFCNALAFAFQLIFFVLHLQFFV